MSFMPVHLRREIRWLACLLLTLVPAAEAAGQGAPPSARPDVSSPLDPLIVLNAASRAAYRRAKEVALARNGPVILVEGDSLVLKNGSERAEVRVIPDRYHVLKALDHVPLALDVWLATAADGGRLDDGMLE
jgi:hypothetical protein